MAQSLASVAEPPLPKMMSLPPRAQPFVNRQRGVADLFGLFARHLARAAWRHRCTFIWMEAATSANKSPVSCFSLAQKGIQKCGLANVVAQFAVLEEDVNSLPQRVIQDFNHLLMHEWILRSGIRAHRSRSMPGRAKVMAFRNVRPVKCRPDFGVAFRRAESHDDVFGMKNGFQPGPEQDRKIERGQRALAHDDGMNKFHRNVLRVGGIRPAPEGEQAASCEKAFRHLAAGFGQARRLAREKLLE